MESLGESVPRVTGLEMKSLYQFCKSTISISFDLNNLKLFVDCAHMAPAYSVSPSVFP